MIWVRQDLGLEASHMAPGGRGALPGAPANDVTHGRVYTPPSPSIPMRHPTHDTPTILHHS
jgi:hypothetical protein